MLLGFRYAYFLSHVSVSCGPDTQKECIWWARMEQTPGERMASLTLHYTLQHVRCFHKRCKTCNWKLIQCFLATQSLMGVSLWTQLALSWSHGLAQWLKPRHLHLNDVSFFKSEQSSLLLEYTANSLFSWKRCDANRQHWWNTYFWI